VNGSAAIDQALPALWQRLYPRMQRVVYGYRILPQDAEDLVQEVLLLAVRKWSVIRDPEAWLLGTLMKCCIIYRRRRSQHHRRFVPLDAIVEATAAIAPVQAKGELLADLGAAARRLPRTQRRLVVLRFHLGLTPLEAARAMGFAHDSVRKILDRAQVRLRELVGELPRPPQAATSRTAGRPRMARQRRPAVPAEWSAAVESWLGVSGYKALTCESYRGHLAAAGIALGHLSQAELAPADLASYRTALVRDGRARRTQSDALRVLSSFLIWACEQGLHAIDAESIRTALRGDCGGA
jgi:RNA polymerase sigma factor (sigma-70 family)